MRLDSLLIRDFRGIDRLDVALDRRLTVLIGDNAAGKTTVLEAIAKGLAPILTRVPGVMGANILREDLHRSQGSLAPYALIRLQAGDLVWDRRYDRKEVFRRLSVEARKRNTPKALWDWIDPIIEARANGADEPALPVLAYYGTDRAVMLREKWPEVQEQESPFLAFRGALKPAAGFGELFAWFLDEESAELRRQRVEPGWINPQLQAVREAVAQVIPGGVSLRVETRPRKHMVVDLEVAPGQREELDLGELSGGYRIVLALVADLARRMAQANPTHGCHSEAIVLIDEVDLHLHPKWQQTVLSSLLSAFPNAQFIVTTHSPLVLASVEAKHIYRLERTVEGVRLSQPGSTYGATPDRVLEDGMGLISLRPAWATDALKALFKALDLGEMEAAETIIRMLRTRLGPFDPDLVRAQWLLDIERGPQGDGDASLQEGA